LRAALAFGTTRWTITSALSPRTYFSISRKLTRMSSARLSFFLFFFTFCAILFRRVPDYGIIKRIPQAVMAGLVPAIHAFLSDGIH
jgi:hypothetical protein